MPWGKKFTKPFFIAIFSLVSIALLAQPENPENKTDQYRAVLWGLKDGLSHPCVYHMLKDVNGFLWTGTQGGLSRFDGSVFKKYYYDPLKPGTINAKATYGRIIFGL